MIRKIDLAATPPHERFAEPTPVGLLCLAIGCAALVPIAFGASLTPAGLRTAAMYCLLFGAGGQAVAGLLNFANRNLYGGTLFTAFAFNWVLNWWVLDSLARGLVPDTGIVLAAEVCFLVIFVVFTYGFGFYSGLLFAFLLDIDLLYLGRIAKSLTGSRLFDLPMALLTIGLGAISLWLAFAMLINPTAGRTVFRLAGPLFRAPARSGFDNTRRRAVVEALYSHWRQHAFEPLPLASLETAVAGKGAGGTLLPDLVYLEELGAVRLGRQGGETIAGARLTAEGIDFFEQVVLGKQQFV
jgi:uncharacterized protein